MFKFSGNTKTSDIPDLARPIEDLKQKKYNYEIFVFFTKDNFLIN